MTPNDAMRTADAAHCGHTACVQLLIDGGRRDCIEQSMVRSQRGILVQSLLQAQEKRDSLAATLMEVQKEKLAAEADRDALRDRVARLDAQMARICAEVGRTYDPSTPLGRDEPAMVPCDIHAKNVVLAEQDAEVERLRAALDRIPVIIEGKDGGIPAGPGDVIQFCHRTLLTPAASLQPSDVPAQPVPAQPIAEEGDGA